MNIVMPQLGETVTEGTVITWYKKKGEWIDADEVLFEVETEKVTTEVPAPISGLVADILVPEGETVDVGTILAVIQQESENAANDAAPAMAASPPATKTEDQPEVAPAAFGGKSASREGTLSPVVRKLLAEHALNAADIAGTGAEGRITRNDVMAHLVSTGKQGATPASDSLKDGRTVIPFNTLRKNTANHMLRSKAASPHVLQAVEVDFAQVAALRENTQESWLAREGFKLTYLPFIARAACLALEAFPHVNASVENESLIVYKHINLGIAVDLDFDGLVAPVVKGAQKLKLKELAQQIQDKILRAKEGKLSADDMTEGTYTISNAGTFGTLITAPIINQPQVAILSADGIKKRPIVQEASTGDTVIIHPVGVLAQSFDHRAIDGAYSAAFLRRLKEIIENHDWEQELA